MPDLAVKVVVDEVHLDSLDSVIRACRESGFVVERVFEEIGTLFGRASEDILPTLSALPGVESVTREETFHAPPPPDPPPP